MNSFGTASKAAKKRRIRNKWRNRWPDSLTFQIYADNTLFSRLDSSHFDGGYFEIPISLTND